MKYYSKYIGECRTRWAQRYDRFARTASHETRDAEFKIKRINDYN